MCLALFTNAERQAPGISPAARTSFTYQETGGIAESLAIVSPSTQAV
jgi:hypothetical protein